MSGRTPREIRKAAHLSLIAAAVHAGVSETTARIYEADRASVSEEKRAQLDTYYARLAGREARSP
jgi:transcriptional regulator with XRE-family HTH domain